MGKKGQGQAQPVDDHMEEVGSVSSSSDDADDSLDHEPKVLGKPLSVAKSKTAQPAQPAKRQKVKQEPCDSEEAFPVVPAADAAADAAADSDSKK